MKRRTVVIGLLGLGICAAVPPLFFWYYEGPRAGRTPDGLYSVFMRHSGEVALEFSRYPSGAEPTQRQVEGAAQLIRGALANADRYRDYDWTTTAGGFSVINAKILNRPDARFYHVWNPAFMSDTLMMDPTAPEALVYYNPGEGQRKQLIGYMYSAPMGVHGEQPGGNLTRWHLHQQVEFCQDSAGIPTVAAERGTGGGCPAGMTNGPTPEMMHVWLVENPYGAFSHRMAVAGEMVHQHAGNPYVEFARRGVRFVAARFGWKPSPEPEPQHPHQMTEIAPLATDSAAHGSAHSH